MKPILVLMALIPGLFMSPLPNSEAVKPAQEAATKTSIPRYFAAYVLVPSVKTSAPEFAQTRVASLTPEVELRQQAEIVPLPAPRPPEAPQAPTPLHAKSAHEVRKPPVSWQLADVKERVDLVKAHLTFLCRVYLKGLNATGKFDATVREYVLTHSEAQSVSAAKSYCPGASPGVVTARHD